VNVANALQVHSTIQIAYCCNTSCLDCACSTLTLLAGHQEWHRACKQPASTVPYGSM